MKELKIYTFPFVTLLARPQFFEPEHLRTNWVGSSTAGERLAEFAGRMCYLSNHNPKGGSNEEYLTNIMQLGHGSVLEHANYSLLIEGVSRSLTHELVRHRAGMAYSQLSQRYVDESDTAFVMPPSIQAMRDVHQHRWRTNMQEARDAYVERVAELMESLDIEDGTLRRKRAREAARSVLPNATETKIVATGNVRAWRHIIALRGHISADMEIRQLAEELLHQLKAEAPHFFGDFYEDDDGSIVPKYNKV